MCASIEGNCPHCPDMVAFVIFFASASPSDTQMVIISQKVLTPQNGSHPSKDAGLAITQMVLTPQNKPLLEHAMVLTPRTMHCPWLQAQPLQREPQLLGSQRQPRHWWLD